MPEPPYQKHFQIHLSTAIVMMFVAGMLMYANRTPRLYDAWDWEHNRNPLTSVNSGSLHLRVFGWPVEGAVIVYVNYGPFSPSGTSSTLNKRTMAINVGLSALILFATWFHCEWLIRRRRTEAVQDH